MQIKKFAAGSFFGTLMWPQQAGFGKMILIFGLLGLDNFRDISIDWFARKVCDFSWSNITDKFWQSFPADSADFGYFSLPKYPGESFDVTWLSNSFKSGEFFFDSAKNFLWFLRYPADMRSHPINWVGLAINLGLFLWILQGVAHARQVGV